MALKLSKPNAKTATDRLTVTGVETEAAEYRRLAQEIDSLKAEQALAGEVITTAVQKARAKADGIQSTVSVASADGDALTVVYKDSYSKIAVQHEPDLRSALGPHYDMLLCTSQDIKAHKGVSLDALRSAVGGKRFDEKVLPLLNVKTAIVFKAKAMQAAEYVRTQENGNKALCRDLDSLFDQQQYKPQINVKVKR